MLRRPPPKARSWRGFVRSAAHRRPPAAWDGAVVERFERLLDDPRFARRSNAVYEALKVDFGHATAPDGKTCLMPPLKNVEARMLTAFKRKQQALRDAAQDSAARAFGSCGQSWFETRMRVVLKSTNAVRGFARPCWDVGIDESAVARSLGRCNARLEQHPWRRVRAASHRAAFAY